MSDYILRPWQPEDRPWLKALWQEAFGDDEDYIETFWSLFLKPGGCIVAEADGKVVSAMYIMDGPMLFPPDLTALSAAYTFALATDPAYRGRGIGTAVYKACTAAALERADTACVLPAEPSLYPFYEKAAGCVPISYVREAVFSRNELDLSGACAAASISVGEYYLRRKSILRGSPYTVMPGEFFALESYHIQRFGGGYLSVDGDVAAVEMDGDTCRIIELLSPEEDWMNVLTAVAARFPAERYLVRTPLFFPGPGEERPFMLAAINSSLHLSYMLPDPWWGFAFD